MKTPRLVSPSLRSRPQVQQYTQNEATDAPAVPLREPEGVAAPTTDLSSAADSTSLERSDSAHKQQQANDRSNVSALRCINPALLSQVAQSFREQISTTVHTKDGLNYSDCFLGRDAVDTLTYVIRSPDRHLALMVGRALNAQKFFEDVTYSVRLRDSGHELYQFQDRFLSFIDGQHKFINDTISQQNGSASTLERYRQHIHHKPLEQSQRILPSSYQANHVPSTEIDETTKLPNGVFTLLLDCYVPTCTRENLCYSITCPRRIEQMARLQPSHARYATLARHESSLSISTTESNNKVNDNVRYWYTTVPLEILDTMSDEEIKRQEAIFELISTEEQYVDDLFVIERTFMKPIVSQHIVSRDQGAREFIKQVFGNVLQIRDIHRRLSNKLMARQNRSKVVHEVSDILIEFRPLLEKPYVQYGGHQPWGKYHLEMEGAINLKLARFLTECKHRPETRRLPIQSFLTRPTTRLGRYPLLLDAILKRTPDGHPDRVGLLCLIDDIKETLAKINKAAGDAENHVRLMLLHEHLVYKGNEEQEMALLDPERRLLRDGTLKRKTTQSTDEISIFLLDNCLLLTKKKKTKYSYEYKILKRSIPLELLVVSCPDDLGRTQPPALTTYKRTLFNLHSHNHHHSPYPSHQRSSTSDVADFLPLSPVIPVSNTSSAPIIHGATPIRPLSKPMHSVSSPDLSALTMAARTFIRPARNLTMHSGQSSSKTSLPLMPSSSISPSLAKHVDYPITFTHLGRHGHSSHTFLTVSEADRKQWVNSITNRQCELDELNHAFNVEIVHPNIATSWVNASTHTPFLGSPTTPTIGPPSKAPTTPGKANSFLGNTLPTFGPLLPSLANSTFKERVNSCVCLDDGRLVLATDDGVYVENYTNNVASTLHRKFADGDPSDGSYCDIVTTTAAVETNDSLSDEHQLHRLRGQAHNSAPNLSVDASSGPSNGIGRAGQFVQVIVLDRVTQIEVLQQFDFILVLADKVLYSYPLEVLEPTDFLNSDFGRDRASMALSITSLHPSSSFSSLPFHSRRASSDQAARNRLASTVRKGRKISSAVSFVRLGICIDKTLVCVAKSSALTSTIKVYEPVLSNKKVTSFGRLLKGTTTIDGLRIFKELYVPTEATSLHFLRTKLCIGTAKGFEVVDIESLQTQSILDPSDPTLEFVLRENARPITMFRLTNMFLLCYADFGVYIDKNGRRTRNNWIVYWHGEPVSFAYHHPHILAFDPEFVEVRHAETGALLQIIPAHQLVCLNPRSMGLHYAMWMPSSILDVTTTSETFTSASTRTAWGSYNTTTTDFMQLIVKLVARK